MLDTRPVYSLTSTMLASHLGVARLRVPARRLPVGVHTLTAFYSGDSAFNPAQLVHKLTVAKAESTTTAELLPARPRRGVPVRLKLGVRTETERAAQGRVVVTVDGHAVAARLRPGEATVGLGVLSRGTHTARVAYRGNPQVGASRTTVTIRIP